MSTFDAMEQRSYNPIIQDFFEWVQKNRVLGLIDPASTEKAWYLPHHLLKTYFASSQYYHLKKLLSVVYQGEEIPVDPHDVARRYSSVFCILLFIGKARYIQRFAQSDKLQDSNLPFIHPEEFPSGADHEDNQEVFERFYQRQWMFCAPELNYRNERVFDENRVLPMVITDILKPGGSANLYKVVLDKNYNYLLNDDGNVPEGDIYANTFVLKTYYGPHAERYFDNEVSAFKRIHASSSSNMIGFYGSFKQGNRFNVLLEYADIGSLDKYFKRVFPPTSGEDIIKFWESLFMLLEGLLKIHAPRDNSSLDQSQPLQGWHQDVKPGNILVSSQSKSVVSPYAYKFKLADLGISHFKAQASPDEDNTDRDSQGTRTYGAPECCRTDAVLRGMQLHVKQNVDVWSLGAVFSEAAVWVVEHNDGLDRYRRDRKAATKVIQGLKDSDCFHDGENMLVTVRDWHRRLKTKTRVYDVITAPVLGMIEDMLLDAEARSNTIQVWRKSQKILNEARSTLNKMQESGSSATESAQRNHFSRNTKSSRRADIPKSSVSESSHSTISTSELSDISEPIQSGFGSVRDETLRQHFPFSAPQVRSPDIMLGQINGTQYVEPEIYRSDSLRRTAQQSQLPPPDSHGNSGFNNGAPNIMMNRTNLQQMHHQSTQSDPLLQTGFHAYQNHNNQQNPSILPRNQVHSMPSFPIRGLTLEETPHEGERNYEQQVHIGGISRGTMDSRRGSHGFTSMQYHNLNVLPGGRGNYQPSYHNPNPPRFSGGWQIPNVSSPPNNSSYVHYPSSNDQYLPPGAPQEPRISPTQIGGWPPEHVPPPNNAQVPFPVENHQDLNQASSNNLQPNAAPGQGNLRPSPSHTPSPEPPLPPSTPKKKKDPPARLQVATAITWKANKKKQKRRSKNEILELPGAWLLDRLKRRDHIFVIDDTASMIDHWEDMTSVFSILAYIVKECDDDGLDLYFTMSSENNHSNHTTPLVDLIKKRRPRGTSEISFRLDAILENYKSRLLNQHSLRRPGHSIFAPKEDVRPLNLYIFTDGAWQEGSDAAPAIKNVVKLLQKLGLPAKQVGIQFISFGDNQENLKKLETLDDDLGLNFDIVDTTPSNGNVWKMLLGAIDPAFDEAENAAVASSSPPLAGPSSAPGLGLGPVRYA